MPARAPKDETFERMVREDASSRDEARASAKTDRAERPKAPKQDTDTSDETPRDQDTQADDAQLNSQTHSQAQSAPTPAMSPEDLLTLQTGAQANVTGADNAQAQSSDARAITVAAQVEPEASPETPVARSPQAKGEPARADLNAPAAPNATAQTDQSGVTPDTNPDTSSRTQEASPQAAPDTAEQKQVSTAKLEDGAKPATPAPAAEQTPDAPSRLAHAQDANAPKAEIQSTEDDARPVAQERVGANPQNEATKDLASAPKTEAEKAPISASPVDTEARAPEEVQSTSPAPQARAKEADTPADHPSKQKSDAKSGASVDGKAEASALTSQAKTHADEPVKAQVASETSQDQRSAPGATHDEDGEAPQAQAQAVASQDKPKAQKNENAPVEEPASDGEIERSAPRRERLLDAYEDKAKAHVEKGAKSEGGVAHQNPHTQAQSTPATPSDLSVEANPEPPAELRRDTPLESLHAKAGVGAQAASHAHAQPSALSDPQASAPLDGGDVSLTGESRIESNTGSERAGQDRAQAHTQAGRFAPAAAHGMAAHIAKKFNEGSKTFDIRLDPPELGKVSVKLELGPNDRIKAILSAERPEALSELQRSARDLEKALQEAGLDVQNGDLSFELNTPHQQGGEQNASDNQGFGPRQTVFFNNPLDEDLSLATRPASVSLYGFALSARQSLNVQA